jgi:hypothetical protein
MRNVFLDTATVNQILHNDLRVLRLPYKPISPVEEYLTGREAFVKGEQGGIYFRADVADPKGVTWVSPMYLKTSDIRIWMQVTRVREVPLHQSLEEYPPKMDKNRHEKVWNLSLSKHERQGKTYRSNPTILEIQFNLLTKDEMCAILKTNEHTR